MRPPVSSPRLLKNPVLPAPAADPWIIEHEGLWYSLQAAELHLELRISSCFSLLDQAEPRIIWRAPSSGPASRNLWAPELHFLESDWVIYVAADDGRNENHRMWTLRAPAPVGPWVLCGPLDTGGWAIDGTVLSAGDERYFVWSGWPGNRDGQQNLYIAPMRDPWTLGGPRRLLAEPTEPWERVAMPLCEGPQILRRGSRTFLVYSASGSWTPDYCLGMLVLEGSDFMSPKAWHKVPRPVFSRTEKVWGVGHCCFAWHPEEGDLLFYHAKTSLKPGWHDRHVRVQRFTWSPEGVPVFGAPAAS